MKHLNIRIFGFVQGVFFRYSAKEKAEELKITGFSRNDPDGTVYIEVEGEEASLEEFLKWCHQGPPPAKIERVQSEKGALKNFTGFTVS